MPRPRLPFSRPSPALVVATLALFVAMGGTGYAVNKINGRQIVKNSITGKKLKKDTLGGREIKETKLGKVPASATADSASTAGNADKLDSLDSAAFQRGARWALVDADGTIMAQSGGITIAHAAGTGDYYLGFGAPVANRAISVTASQTLTDVGRVGVEASPCGGGAQGASCPAGSNDTNHLVVGTTNETLASGGQPEGFYAVVLP